MSPYPPWYTIIIAINADIAVAPVAHSHGRLRRPRRSHGRAVSFAVAVRSRVAVTVRAIAMAVDAAVSPRACHHHGHQR